MGIIKKFIYAIHIIFLILLIQTSTSYAIRETGNINLEYNDISVNGYFINGNFDQENDTVVLIVHNIFDHYGTPLIRNIQQTLRTKKISSLAINLSLNINDRKGAYDCSNKHTHKNSDALSEIRFWVKWLSSHGVKKIILMGHLRSANQVAWYLATQDDPEISGLVLLAPYIWNDTRNKKIYKKYHNLDFDKVNQKAINMVKHGESDSFLKNIGIFHCKNSSVTASSFLSYFSKDHRRYTPNLIPSIQVKTLILIGDKDRLTGKSYQEYKNLSSIYKHIKPIIVKDANHTFKKDKHIENIATIINKSIRQ